MARYYKGKHGVPQDHARCVEWAAKAAEGGDSHGQFRLGYVLVLEGQQQQQQQRHHNHNWLHLEHHH